jgi:ABC-type phosphate/phosphonate transport system substrate-binding protein
MKNTMHKVFLSKRLVFTAIILTLVFACTTQNSPEPQSVKIESEVSASIVSVDNAIKIAESFEGFEDDKNQNNQKK